MLSQVAVNEAKNVLKTAFNNCIM